MKQIDKPQDNYAYHLQLVKLYLLGDYLIDRLLCRQVLQAFVNHRYDAALVANPGAINLAWEHTTEDSPLRKVIKELWFTLIINKSVETFRGDSEYSKDFILDIFAETSNSHRALNGKTIANKTSEQTKADCARYISELGVEEAAGESN